MLTWFKGLPPWSIDSFDTLINRFNFQYAMSWSYLPTFAALASLQQEDDESLCKFIDRFGRLVVQIRNLNPEVTLHFMLLTLWPDKFVGSLWKKPPRSVDMFRERAKGYIQMEEGWSSEMMFDRLDKSVRKEKLALGSTHTSRTRDKNRTRVSLFQGEQGTSGIHPWRQIEPPSSKKPLMRRYPYNYPLYLLPDLV